MNEILRRARLAGSSAASWCEWGQVLVKRRRPVWFAAAAALFCVGSAAAVIGARVAAFDDAGRSRQNFVSSSTDIASTLRLAIAREEDLALGAGAFFADNTATTQAAFLQWIESTRAFMRDP